MLHTEALLSAINFLSTALSSGGGVPSPEKEVRPKTEDKTVSAKSSQYHTHPPTHTMCVWLKTQRHVLFFSCSCPGVTCRLSGHRPEGGHGSRGLQRPSVRPVVQHGRHQDPRYWIGAEFCFLWVFTTKPDVTRLLCTSGINGSLLMQGPQTHISGGMRDFIVLNVDPKSFHKKVSKLSYIRMLHSIVSKLITSSDPDTPGLL